MPPTRGHPWCPLCPLPPGQPQINSAVSPLPALLFDAGIATQLFDHALNGITVCRMQFENDQPVDFLYLYANRACEAQTGIDPQGALGSTVFPELHGRDRVFFEACVRVARGGGAAMFCMFLFSVGSWFEFSFFSPAPDCFVAMFNVVTPQVEKSNALRLRNRWWSDGINATSDAVFVCDSEGRVLDVNDALVKFHRFESREACLDAIANYRTQFEVGLLDGTTVPFFQWAVPRALRGESAVQQEFRLTRTDTGERWVGSYDFAPIKSRTGAVIGAIVVGRDVTAEHQRCQALEQLQRSVEQLSESTVASVTAAALAHELNQPLTTLALSASAALYMLDAGIPCEQELRSALTLARDGAEHAGDVVRDLLAFLHKRPVRMERIDLTELVRQAVQRLQTRVLPDVKLRTQLSAEPVWVLGNALQLEKVLSNLFSNGLEAMRTSAHPQALCIRLRREANGTGVRLSVVDSGEGIPPGQLHRVFEPFFTTKPTGVGMGLAICEALVKAHGGRIWARSKPGRGATFHFVLPSVDGNPAVTVA